MGATPDWYPFVKTDAKTQNPGKQSVHKQNGLQGIVTRILSGPLLASVEILEHQNHLVGPAVTPQTQRGHILATAVTVHLSNSVPLQAIHPLVRA